MNTGDEVKNVTKHSRQRSQYYERTTGTFETAYDTQYSLFIMAEARRDVSNMLDEYEEEPRSVREQLRKHQQEQTALRKKEKVRDR